MTLVELMEIDNERTSQDRAAIKAYIPRSDELSSPRPILVPKGQHLDVDGILARSLPKLGAVSTRDVKTIVLREV